MISAINLMLLNAVSVFGLAFYPRTGKGDVLLKFLYDILKVRIIQGKEKERAGAIQGLEIDKSYAIQDIEREKDNAIERKDIDMNNLKAYYKQQMSAPTQRHFLFYFSEWIVVNIIAIYHS